MDQPPDRRLIAIVAAVVIGGAALAHVFLGGRVNTVLSTVGASIGSRDATGTGEAPPEPTSVPTTGAKVAAVGAVPPPTLLIVRTGSIAVEVSNVDAAIRAADGAVTAAGGYVEGSNRSAANDDIETSIAYRIPSAAWAPTVDTIRALGARLLHEEIKTEEVSGQVVDLGARIANLRATEAALQSIMAKATRIDDVLDVQKELTATRGEIERLVADKAHLEDRASFGSLTVGFRLPARAAPSPSPDPAAAWDPGRDVRRATDRLVTVGQGATSLAIWLGIVGLPVLLGATVILFVGWQVVRLGRWLVDRGWQTGNQAR